MTDRLLDTVNGPADVRRIALSDLPRLASEIRDEIVKTVSRTGGHLASSLGAVELAIALHYTFNTPGDILVWDVGHQTYAHKLLTGRRTKFATLRQLGGISGFPNKEESPEHDVFTSGHSSTSISTALGLVMARDLKREKRKVIAVIGDASLAGGMSFEALNHAGHTEKDIIVILNDNERSISQSVGALSKYLTRILANPAYNKIRRDVEHLVKRIPRFGFRAYRAARKLEEGLKNLLIPGMLFEEMGFRYFGPIDGHNITRLVGTFRNLMDLNEPILIHVITRKGKGYSYAEANPISFHGTGPFNPLTGRPEAPSGTRPASFTEAFGEKMVSLAEKDTRIVGITAAMLDGTGLKAFAELFPERFFDVGIAEEHAIAFGAGLARGGLRPVVAIYSTFLQRGYDQIIHDVCLQNLPVVFCLDRAGIAGEDGPTHHGAFDISYLRHIPNLVCMAPATPGELKSMLEFAIGTGKPVAIRYPKGSAVVQGEGIEPIILGKAQILRRGNGIAIIAIGSMAGIAIDTAKLLEKKKINAMVVNARFIKPLDTELLVGIARDFKRIYTIEDGVLEGGFGSSVLELFEREGCSGNTVRRIGLPDKFIEHGKRNEILTKYNLTPDAICDVIIGEGTR